MIDRMLLESNQLPEKPELGILLKGCVTDAERKAVHEAFYTFAQGDPGGFSVQFTVLLQAHARILKCAPEQLRKALAMELEHITDVIVSSRSLLNNSASTITKDAADIHDQVVCLAEFQRELRVLVSKMRESEAAAREKFLARISDETNANPGRGKTSMMQEAVKAVAALSGRDVLVVAPSTSAVKVLKEQGFSGADTFQRLMQSQLLQDVARGRILWIDEAGFLSTRQMRWAVDFAAKNDCRLILFGDTRQHHSVDRGDALRVLEDSGSIDQVTLTKIFRQQVPALREAVEDLSRGETEAGFDKLEAAGLIHGVEDTDQRLEAIASQHLAAVGDGATSLIVAPTHAECRAIAARVRELQKTACLVGPEEHQVVCLERLNLTESQRRDVISYRAGQVVEFHRRARGGFKSGEKWEVIASDEKGVTVSRAGKQTLLPLAQANSFELSERRDIALAAGDSVRITKNFRCGADRFTNNELCRVGAIDQAGIHLDDGRLIKVAEAVHLDQGIAVTSHASQGKTVDQVIVSVPVSAFSQANQAQFYVSMSRARASMHLFTDSKAALKEAVMRPSERLSPYEFISKSGNGRDLVAFVTRSGREAVKQTEREMER